MTCWLLWADLPFAMMVALIGVTCWWLERGEAVVCSTVWIPWVLLSTGGGDESAFEADRRSSSSEDKRSSHLRETVTGFSFTTTAGVDPLLGFTECWFSSAVLVLIFDLTVIGSHLLDDGVATLADLTGSKPCFSVPFVSVEGLTYFLKSFKKCAIVFGYQKCYNDKI